MQTQHGIRVEKTERAGRYLAEAWRGKATKHYAYLIFKTEERRDAWVGEQFAYAKEAQEEKAARLVRRREEAKTVRASVAVGTMLCNSWGYDQTNVDYYEVVRRSSSGATVWVRSICGATVQGSEGMDCDSVVPSAGSFRGDEIQKTVGPNGVQFRHGWTSVVDTGEKHYRSWYA